MTLSGRLVVIIGGTSGIGRAVAEGALREGAVVIVASSSAAKIEAAGMALPAADCRAVDVRKEDSLKEFFAGVGAFDHLVFTAGDWGPARGMTLDALDRATAESLFAVRFWGAVAAVKHAVPHLRETGSITLTDGMVAHRPRRGTAVSTAMAGAVEHLTRGLAAELAPIRVNAVCPGAIRTDVWNAIPAETREERMRAMTKHLPIARVGEPQEAAEAYLYLMRGGYTTGQILRVDGGGSLV